MSKNKVYYLLVLLCCISLTTLSLFDLFHPGLPLTHDGKDHVARIANFYINLQEGVLIPRWASNLNWGYGHPILMFLYPLPSYTASLFHLLGFSLVDSTKLVFGLSYIASGYAMYLWIKNAYGREAGIVSGIAYMFAPYRFIDLYVRGALGEHVAFVFAPLICYFLLKIAKTNNNTYLIGGSTAIAGLLLSHNAMSLIFIPFTFIYICYLFIKEKRKRNYLLKCLLSFFGGFGLAGFFWIPAFFEGKYTLRDIVTQGGEYATHFRIFTDFFTGQWNYQGSPFFNVSLGFVHWLFVIVGIIFLILNRKRRNSIWISLFFLEVIFLLSLFLVTEHASVLWKNISILQKFQFPWRFLSLTVFASSIIAGISTTYLSIKWKKISLFFIFIIILLSQHTYWKANGYLAQPESFYKTIYNGTTDTGESAPLWSVRFMEKRPVGSIEVLEGKAAVLKNERKSTKHVYLIETEEGARMKENTLYFPGWEVYINGKKSSIEFQDQRYHGVITFFVPSGINEVVVVFKETKLRILANIISGATLIIVCIYAGLIYKDKKGLIW